MVLEVLLEYHREVALSGDQELVEAFPAEGADEAFRDRVHPWCPYRVRMIRMSVPVKTASNVAVNFVVPVADQEQELVGAFAEVHQEVAGLLGHPGLGGMGGDPGEVYAATAVLDHQQDVQAAEEDGVDVGEVDGKDRVGLPVEELRPGRPGPPRRGIDARHVEDLPCVLNAERSRCRSVS